MFVVIVTVNGIKNYLKQKKVSAKKNRIITLTVENLLDISSDSYIKERRDDTSCFSDSSM